MGENANRRQIGSQYEQVAAEYLQEHGYKILEKNYHAGRYGELDIIAQDYDGLLVICECKYRSRNALGSPLDAVDWRKQQKICRCTLFYYKKCGYGLDHSCRFDVIAISGNGTVEHIKNAFDFRY